MAPRLVANDLSKQEGIDYIETFSPIANTNSIRLILSLVTRFRWQIHQMPLKLGLPDPPL